MVITTLGIFTNLKFEHSSSFFREAFNTFHIMKGKLITCMIRVSEILKPTGHLLLSVISFRPDHEYTCTCHKSQLTFPDKWKNIFVELL
jgi:hypothetical protein